MHGIGNVRIHEIAFCGDVKSWSDALFVEHKEWPFAKAAIEEFGRGNNKRQDLRIFDREHQTPVLCGEVKMPTGCRLKLATWYDSNYISKDILCGTQTVEIRF